MSAPRYSLDSFAIRLAALLVSVLPSTVIAQGSGPTASDDGKVWMLTLAALVDEESYENLFAGFNLGLTGATWLSLSAGRSSAPSTAAQVTAGLFSAGIEHNFGPIGLALATDRWGDTDALETADWREEVFFANERFRVALLLEQRDFEIYFTGGILLPGPRQQAMDADGIGLGGRLRATPRWRVYWSWMDYDYPPGVRLIPRLENLDRLSVPAATLAYSLVDEFTRIGIERSFGLKLVTFDLGSDRSAVDGSTLDSVSAGVLWPVGRRLDLEVHLGASRSEGYPSSLFGGLSLIVYGGG